MASKNIQLAKIVRVVFEKETMSLGGNRFLNPFSGKGKVRVKSPKTKGFRITEALISLVGMTGFEPVAS